MCRYCTKSLPKTKHTRNIKTYSSVLYLRGIVQCTFLGFFIGAEVERQAKIFG